MSEYVGVHLLDNPYGIDRIFDYFVPPHLREAIAVGDFVTVPFGTSNRRSIGLVVAQKNAPDDSSLSCKPIFCVCDRTLSLSPEMQGLCFFIKEQTLCTIGDAVRAMMPASALLRVQNIYRLQDGVDPHTNQHFDAATLLICDFIRKKGSVHFDLLQSKFGPAAAPALEELAKAGILQKDIALKTVGEKTENLYSLSQSVTETRRILDKKGEVSLRSAAHEKILCVLCEKWDNGEKEFDEQALATLCGVSQASIRSLCEKGLLQKRRLTIDRSLIAEYETDEKEIRLNEEQSAAYDVLCELADSPDAKAALLHGVTGSGKTSVMLRTIDHVLQRGKGVIVLLPEIALTPQSLAIFCSRYGNRVAIVHSGLSAGERFDTYRRIKRGDADVVIGTRSAVFAPLENLGLIIMDEEQEHTYKSDMNPKYHARDIARYRCAHHHALMLLASATPSFESYTKAKKGAYTLIELKSRYGGAILPTATVVDMRRETAKGSLSPLSTLLCQRLVENHAAGNQSILFLNRRGYNNFLSCRSCGKAIECPKCSVSMAYHVFGNAYDGGELRCHWCGFRAPLPKVCPQCGSEHLSRMGFGTQKVEEELSALLPTARILRMDADTTGSRFSYDSILGKFRRHEADILLGTQMVTKGHDFPDVTLVGVLLADSSLYLDDYRATERTFSMLTQVIGRAGRGAKAGEAIIQTANPDSECIRLACKQDFASFYETEIRLRRSLQFPPFCDVALLTITGSDETELAKAATILHDEFCALHQKEFSDLPIDAFGPFEAPVYRVENRYRMRMVVKCVLNRRSRALFSRILEGFSHSGIRGLSLSVDFNPSSL